MKKTFSKILNQNITIDDKARTVTTDDGAVYNEQELNQLKGLNQKEIISIHKVKLLFQGVII